MATKGMTSAVTNMDCNKEYDDFGIKDENVEENSEIESSFSSANGLKHFIDQCEMAVSNYNIIKKETDQLDAMTEDSMPVSVAQKCQYNPVVSTCNSEQSSFENSVAENNLMEEPSYKSLRLEGDMDSQEHVLYKDSHMPISGLTVKLEPPSPERPNNFLSTDYVSQLEHKKREEGPNSFHIKLEPVDREENFSPPDLSPDSPLSSSSGSYLPQVPSPIPSQVLKDEDVSAFRNTVVKSEDKQKQLQLIKLSQIRSAFSNVNRSNERPKSIGQMFALKKRIKEAQLNGDSSLSENSKRFRAILPDGKVSMID